MRQELNLIKKMIIFLIKNFKILDVYVFFLICFIIYYYNMVEIVEILSVKKSWTDNEIRIWTY